ncbi:protein piccolo-like isoform X2 [Homarus americanus]|uniref:protein piccolo-like isoform X2 n=1 Tax=Homarus americanus TaxID=6706 RepID=UPI001C43E5CA|nr:protein piccolo-like isoform X2 [Homarus americanus]
MVDSSPQHQHYNTSQVADYRPPRGGISPINYQDGNHSNHDDGRPPRRPRVGGPRPSKVKRYLLTRDPKDRRISGNGLGMKVVGGKEIPGTKGRLGAYVARLHPSGVAEALGVLKEGDLLLEWNGVSLVDRTYEEVQAIVVQSVDDVDVEIVVRSDINMITGERMAGASSRSGGYHGSSVTYTSPCYQSPRRRPNPIPDDPLDINGNRSNFDCPVYNSNRNNSQENIYINENRFGERDGDATMNGKMGNSPKTDRTRVRSTSRPVHHGVSPEMHGRSQTSPVLEEVADHDLHQLHDEGLPVLNSASQRGSPSQSQSPTERHSPNGAVVSGGVGSQVLPERSGPDGAVSSPPRHHNTAANRRRPNSRNNVKVSGTGPSKANSEQQMGEVQLQVCYDSRAGILYVTVLRARSLYTVRDDGDTRPDPFVKVYLLPGRSVENQRRTRFLSCTSSPDWNQTMVYPNLQPGDLAKRHLEVTAWNFQANKPNEFLGEVVLNLSDSTLMDEQARWYQLQEPDRAEFGE